ncbi:uncharacterized protein LOC135485867 [Lineus longissimus]|uniref:uncharacterized protein LOC135485867 n=1 Tax=Lineus longissimus TaxID=88925 RepID=UPI002B4D9C2E
MANQMDAMTREIGSLKKMLSKAFKVTESVIMEPYDCWLKKSFSFDVCMPDNSQLLADKITSLLNKHGLDATDPHIIQACYSHKKHRFTQYRSDLKRKLNGNPKGVHPMAMPVGRFSNHIFAKVLRTPLETEKSQRQALMIRSFAYSVKLFRRDDGPAEPEEKDFWRGYSNYRCLAVDSPDSWAKLLEIDDKRVGKAIDRNM